MVDVERSLRQQKQSACCIWAKGRNTLLSERKNGSGASCASPVVATRCYAGALAR